MPWKDFIDYTAENLKLTLTGEQIKKFERFFHLLLEWNEKVNLTSITEEKEVLFKHFYDSLTCYPYLKDLPSASILDVGTGGGFPGIPLKIIFDGMKVNLLDSLQKRLKFLQLIADEISLSFVNVMHGRAEDYGQDKKYRQQFDFVLSRAVARLNVLSEYCLPFVKVGGTFIAMKGSDSQEIDEGTKAIELLGGKVLKIDRFELPFDMGQRNLVIIKKVKDTPPRFPRKPVKITKEPLI